MKVIVAGSRNIHNFDINKVILDSGFIVSEVVCGYADGIDTLGKIWAEENNIPVSLFPADWNNILVSNAVVKTNKYGKQYNALAGFIRNEQMAEYADALIVIYYSNSRGSIDMLTRAKRHKLKIYEVKINETDMS